MTPTKLPKELKSALSIGLKSVKSVGVNSVIGRANLNRIVIWKNKITGRVHVDFYEIVPFLAEVESVEEFRINFLTKFQLIAQYII